MKSSNQSLSNIVVFPFLLIITILTSIALDFSNTDPLAIFLFYANGFFFALMVVASLRKSSFSIELICWLFMFFFMFYAPLIQYTRQTFPWRGNLSTEDIIICNVLILLFSIFFCIGKKIYRFVSPRREKKEAQLRDAAGFIYSPLRFSRSMRVVTLLVSMVFAAIFLSRNGFDSIVVSRADAVNPFYSGDNSAIFLIVDSFIPAFLAYGTAVAGQRFKNEKKGLLSFLIQLICLLICCFPTTIPRYKMACIYAPLAMIIFPVLKKKCYFFWAFVLAIFFVLPVFSDIRYRIDFQSAVTYLGDNFLGTYTEVDYDAYRMLAGTVHYVREFGITSGMQLLGTLFFFVPSSIWKGKPGGSGSTVIRATLSDDAFSNVSCPFVAEGYINFGIVGIVLFAVILGYIVKKFDTRYWLIARKQGIQFSPYLYLMLLFFFMLRGDLLSSFAYIVGFMATGYIMKVGSKLFESRKG